MFRLASLSIRAVLGAALAGAALLGAVPILSATSAPAVSLGPSGLPLPRFVSLKSGRVNLRIGPGLGYAVDWLYLKSGLPMEIIQEYDNWRRVRDAEGAEGWINQSLLSGKRTGIAAPWQRGKDTTVPLFAAPGGEAAEVAIIEPGAIGTIRVCDGKWCEMSFAGHIGWMEQDQVWGAYPGERIKE